MWYWVSHDNMHEYDWRDVISSLTLDTPIIAIFAIHKGLWVVVKNKMTNIGPQEGFEVPSSMPLFPTGAIPL